MNVISSHLLLYYICCWFKCKKIHEIIYHHHYYRSNNFLCVLLFSVKRNHSKCFKLPYFLRTYMLVTNSSKFGENLCLEKTNQWCHLQLECIRLDSKFMLNNKLLIASFDNSSQPTEISWLRLARWLDWLEVVKDCIFHDSLPTQSLYRINRDDLAGKANKFTPFASWYFDVIRVAF